MPEHDKTAPDFDLIVIGTGPAGMMAAISAARCGRRVLLLEKLAQPGTKLKATGGGRCNLANTLDTEEFIKRFGKEGRFMTPALKAFDHSALMAFFEEIGVKCHAPDGMRIFPVDHNATTVVSGLTKELTRLHVSMQVSNKAAELICRDGQISGIISNDATIGCTNVILATGGRGYPTLGSTGDGFAMAKALGHTITDLFPAMLPLTVKESWVKNCRADTI
ncbi:MAG: aminoacetone oxidase family FAD-binding enzyme, partial [Candidatus Riflebacteria bacterium]|nr:aminoacetone oxidase family FAD-binding enzyme [Candidatus Riflebacteria bacterium]